MDSSGKTVARRHEETGQVTDVTLVRRIVARDESALAEVYDRYASLVYAVALRVLRDTGEAEEILQDIFHQLWIVALRFDPARGSLPGWLTVSARNRSIDRLRRRQPETEPGAGPEEIQLPFDLEEHVARCRAGERVRAAMYRLPDGQRALVEQAFFEGLTHTELARKTGEPLGTVKSRLRAAIAALRRDLTELAGTARAGDD
jgi:RNA polymerase sigma-70 factor (ECF subfamily)